MNRYILLLLLLGNGARVFAQQQHNDYFPPRGQWEHRRAAALGVDSAQLAGAIQFARENEAKMSRDQELAQAETFGRNEPFDEPVGPLKDGGTRRGSSSTKDISWPNGGNRSAST